MRRSTVPTTERECSELSVQQMKSWMANSAYKKAASFGRRVWNENMTTLFHCVVFAEFCVYYALALIYTGHAKKGITILQQIIIDIERGRNPLTVAKQNSQTVEGKHWNWVLGKAYNNWAYAEWMNYGNHKRSIELFICALPYFIISEFEKELATTWDNMGRVYSLLGDHARAYQYVDDAFELRRKLPDVYRTALSYNSQAIVRLAAGEPHTAWEFAENALAICEQERKLRGIGLAHITLGRIMYDLGQSSEIKATQEWFFKQSIAHLDKAASIFTTGIEEPVRLAEVYREIGYIYHTQAMQSKNTPLKSRIKTVKDPKVLSRDWILFESCEFCSYSNGVEH